MERDDDEYRKAPSLKEKIRLHGRRHVSVESYAEHTCENVPVSRLPSCFCVMSRRGLLSSTPRARVVDPVLLSSPLLPSRSNRVVATKCSSAARAPIQPSLGKPTSSQRYSILCSLFAFAPRLQQYLFLFLFLSSLSTFIFRLCPV